MGRELRRVPPNWQHPQEDKYNPFKGITETRYKPLFDEAVDVAWNEWWEEFEKWKAIEGDRVRAEYGEADYPKDQPYAAFCAWHGSPPDPDYYRPAWNEGEATWFQVYETVSEGTPVTPPFETQDELIVYLMNHGDFWDQSRRKEGRSSLNCDPWSREAAEKFVLGTGWAPSLVSIGGQVMSGVDAMAITPPTPAP